MPRISSKERCAYQMLEAVAQGNAFLKVAALQRQSGLIQHAITALRAAAETAGEAWGCYKGCELVGSTDDTPIHRLRQDIGELEKKIGDDCRRGQLASK